MRQLSIVALLILAFPILSRAQLNNSISVRDILINQPDYIGTEAFTSAFMGHGFSVSYKTAKRGDCYRRQSETQITYSCLNQADTVFYPRTREYRQETGAKGPGADALFISDVPTVAKTRQDVQHTLARTQENGKP